MKLAKLICLLLFTLSFVAQAQLMYQPLDGVMTVTGYVNCYASDFGLTIPTTLDGQLVRSINSSAFSHCRGLTNLVVAASVTNIGSVAFFGCERLVTVFIPSSVKNVGYLAFNGNTKLLSIEVDGANAFYRSIDGVLFDKGMSKLIAFPLGRSGSYSVPDGVTQISDSAFKYAGGLTNITLPDSVTNVGVEAFNSCPNLRRVNLGKGIKVIGAGAFAYSKNLDRAIIPEGIQNIPEQAFYTCSGLVSITLPNGITNIGSMAFQSCSSLSRIVIPDSVGTIGAGAFEFCESLATAVIGAGVTNLGNLAFFNATRLQAAYFRGNAPTTDQYAFGGDARAVVYYLPETIGWGSTLGSRPTAKWDSTAPLTASGLAVRDGQINFSLYWAPDQSVVVEAATNLTNPAWTPLSTNVLTGGSSYFSDPQWTNYPSRLYRLRAP